MFERYNSAYRSNQSVLHFWIAGILKYIHKLCSERLHLKVYVEVYETSRESLQTMFVFAVLRFFSLQN